ncbi:chemotaxis protein CheB [Dactylosporangium vinaceum]|uniref:protein-glutamate methylesterase n=1 Tax=Dactylosporangium vinaceum TaxID=53362 RepID=A0ABV5MEL4_9ACTN|nr:chemotaxis protein CheB [Dactylosporangium vinaceum]UAB92360.1 chemotaxis protein CheB [Dactylosporangium vinaceum]
MTEPRGIVVVGASAGGVEALRAFCGALPADLPGAVCVVLHIPRDGGTALPNILNRSGPLPAAHASDGAALEAGRVYVAPPNRHLLIRDGHLRLSHGPVENGHRPAADPLFRSAARWWGASVLGVVLSGNRDDGAYGLAEVARQGGVGLIQDPAEALYPSMPRHAAAQVPTARTLPVAMMGPALAELLADLPGPAPRDAVEHAALDAEDAMAAMEAVTADEIGGVPAGFGCPSCHGALFEMPAAAGRFRCRVGHAWSAAGLLGELGGTLEGALWMALRSLEEKAALSRRMADSARVRGFQPTAGRYSEAAGEAEAAGKTIRQLIERLGDLSGGVPEDVLQ